MVLLINIVLITVFDLIFAPGSFGRKGMFVSCSLYDRLSRPHYRSASYSISQILFIFGSAIDLSITMNLFDYYFYFLGSSGTLKLSKQKPNNSVY